MANGKPELDEGFEEIPVAELDEGFEEVPLKKKDTLSGNGVPVSSEPQPIGATEKPNPSLDRRLPYLKEQAAKSFAERPDIFSNPNARQAYYDRLSKPYSGRDYFKVRAALMEVDPYAKKEAQEQAVSAINPVGETIPTAIEAAAHGITEGVKQGAKTKEVIMKEGIASGTFNAAVATGKTILGAAGVLIPELAAYNVATQGLEQTAPEIAQHLSPITTNLEKKYKEVGIPVPKWKENWAAVGDFALNLAAGLGLHYTGKLSPVEAAKIIEEAPAEKIKEAAQKTDEQYTAHQDEQKVSDLESDIAKNPASPVTPILQKEATDLHTKISDEQLQRAQSAAELTNLQDTKAALEKSTENLSETGKQAVQPTIDAVDDKIKQSAEQIKVPELAKTEVKENIPVEEKKVTKQKSTGRYEPLMQIESHNDAHTAVKQYFLGGGRINAESMIKELFGFRKNKKGEEIMPKEEYRTRWALTSKKAPTVDGLAHDLWEHQPEASKLTTEDYRNAIIETLSEFPTKNKMAESLEKSFDKKYNLSEEEIQTEEWFQRQMPEEYIEPLTPETVKNVWQKLSDEEKQQLKDFEGDLTEIAQQDKFNSIFTPSLIDKVRNEIYYEKERERTGGIGEPEKTYASPEQRQHEERVANAEKQLASAKEKLKSKRAELEKTLQKDTSDLFGERESERGVLFSERTDATQFEKALQPEKLEVESAERELAKLRGETFESTPELTAEPQEITPPPPEIPETEPTKEQLVEEDIQAYKFPSKLTVSEKEFVRGKGTSSVSKVVFPEQAKALKESLAEAVKNPSSKNYDKFYDAFVKAYESPFRGSESVRKLWDETMRAFPEIESWRGEEKVTPRQQGTSLIKEGLNELSQAIGKSVEIRKEQSKRLGAIKDPLKEAEERAEADKKIFGAMGKIAEGMLKTGEATVKDIWEKLLRYLKGQKIDTTALEKHKQEIVKFAEEYERKSFIETVKSSPESSKELVERASELTEFYKVISNKEALYKADKEIQKLGISDAKESVMSNSPATAEKSVMAIRLIKHFEKSGDFDSMIEVLNAYDNQLRDSGRFIQAATLWNRLEPTTIVRAAKKMTGKYKKELSSEAQKKIVEMMGEVQKMPEGDAKQKATMEVLNYIAEQLPHSPRELFDAYRYQNMLSSPRSHLRNIYGNFFNVFVTEPLTLATKSGYDMFGSIFNPAARDVKFSDIPKYYKDAIAIIPEAFVGAVETYKQGYVANKIMDLPKAENMIEAVRKTKLPKYLTVAMRFLEAQDRFFSVLIGQGERMRLMRQGISEGKANEMATKLATEYLYREKIDSSDKTRLYSVRALDALGEGINYLRKRPVIGEPISWFTPFVTTPINIAKMGMKFSPMAGIEIGIGKGLGKRYERNQIAQATVGSILTGMGAVMAMQGLTSWSVPTDKKEKELFYASGRKPYSVKIGDEWIPMMYLGALALPFAIPAAVKHYYEDSKKAMTDNDAQKIGKAIADVGGFVLSQTPMEGLEKTSQVFTGGYMTDTGEQLGQISTQVIPLSGLVRYTNTILDPVFRKSDGYVESVEKMLPELSKELEAYKTPSGEEAKREPVNYALPFDIGFSDEEYEVMLQNRIHSLQRKSGAFDTGKIKVIKEKVEKVNVEKP